MCIDSTSLRFGKFFLRLDNLIVDLTTELVGQCLHLMIVSFVDTNGSNQPLSNRPDLCHPTLSGRPSSQGEFAALPTLQLPLPASQFADVVPQLVC
jgi:hypothetical protein